MLTSHVTNRRRAVVTLGDDCRLLVHAPGPPPTGARKDLKTATCIRSNLRHVFTLCDRHMPKPSMDSETPILETQKVGGCETTLTKRRRSEQLRRAPQV